LETTEYYGACELCKTTRRLWRGRYDNSFLWAEYTYPNGYLAPAGSKWDPAVIREEYHRRFPIKGRTKVVTRR